LRSIRSFSRARRSSESGYALIAAIVLAVLYFALVELLLLDSSRELAEARRFRARVIAQTLAENGAELAAVEMGKPERTQSSVRAEDWQGEMSGHMTKTSCAPPACETPEWPFEIEAVGKTRGLVPIATKVMVKGRVVETAGQYEVRIQYTTHTP
jgi:Tfp pilus assembly protein PilX